MSDFEFPDSDENPDLSPSQETDIEVLRYCIDAGWNLERDDQGLARLIGDFSNTPLEGLQMLLSRVAGFAGRLGITEAELDKLSESLEWVLKTCAFFEILEDETDDLEGMIDAGNHEDLENLEDELDSQDSDNWWKEGNKPPWFGDQDAE